MTFKTIVPGEADAELAERRHRAVATLLEYPFQDFIQAMVEDSSLYEYLQGEFRALNDQVERLSAPRESDDVIPRMR